MRDFSLLSGGGEGVLEGASLPLKIISKIKKEYDDCRLLLLILRLNKIEVHDCI